MRCAQIRHRAFFKSRSICHVSESPWRCWRGSIGGFFWGLGACQAPLGSPGRSEEGSEGYSTSCDIQLSRKGGAKNKNQKELWVIG